MYEPHDDAAEAAKAKEPQPEEVVTLGVKCSQLDHWRKRFAWALDRRFDFKEGLDNLQITYGALGDSLKVAKELFDADSFTPNPGETADSEKAALANYLNEIGETLIGIAYALMLRAEFFPTEGIPDGPPADSANMVPPASSIVLTGSDPGVVQ